MSTLPSELLPCSEPPIEEDLWFPLVSDAAEDVLEELPPVVEIVGGIVAEQSKLVIGSGSKSYKTWLSIDMALSVAHGLSFLGRATERRRVLYVNLELKKVTFTRRLQAIAKSRELKLEAAWFRPMHLRGKLAGMTIDAFINRLIRFAKHFQIRVVVLDPIYKINFGGDENSAGEQTMLFNQIDRLTTEAECTVIMNDHFGKGNQSEKDPLDTIRGSSAKGGDVDAAMILRKHDEDGCFRVDMVHRELPPVAPFCIGWNHPVMQLRPDLDPEAMKKAKPGRGKSRDPKALLRHIQHTTNDAPISQAAWAKAAGIVRQTLTDYLPEMRQLGWVVTVGAGNSARQCITAKGLAMLREEIE